jgi:hypothetical protein
MQELETIISDSNDLYDDLIRDIDDPGWRKKEEEAIKQTMPVMAAGMRALDNLRWEFEGARQAKEMIG